MISIIMWIRDTGYYSYCPQWNQPQAGNITYGAYTFSLSLFYNTSKYCWVDLNTENQFETKSFYVSN
jgi:hypothetical protein